MRKRLDPDAFRAAAKEGSDRGALLCKGLVPERKEVDLEARTIDFVISTGSVDRDGDTIDPAGWDLSNYRRNPVVLWAHDVRQPPIARAIEISNASGSLTARAQFAAADTYPFAETVFRLYADGFLNAVSVGFLAREWEFTNDDNREFGLDFKTQELLEFSGVPVPSNPEALIQARSKGIDMGPMVEWAEQVLDGQHRVLLPAKLVERIRSAASGRTVYVLSPDEQDELLKSNLNLIRSGEAIEQPDDTVVIGMDVGGHDDVGVVVVLPDDEDPAADDDLDRREAEIRALEIRALELLNP